MLIQIENITIEVTRKKIKHMYARVLHADGRVLISAPNSMKTSEIQDFAESNLGWIRKQLKKIQEKGIENTVQFIDNEHHYVWGKAFLLSIRETQDHPSVQLTKSHLILKIRSGADGYYRMQLLEAWYRKILKEAIADLLAKWGPVTGVDIKKFYVQRMKTRWGSCNLDANTIRISTELARKPPECLELVVVHEMVHFLERKHTKRFYALMQNFLPDCDRREQLLKQNVGHLANC